MSLGSATELKVGAVVLAVLGLIVFMSFSMSEDPSYLGTSKKYFFYTPDASGLIKKSSIKLAGIDVGVIRDIQLRDGLAYVEITLKSDIKLSPSSRVEVRANGILGDKYVEVVPGDIRDGVLEDGSQILEVRDTGSLAALMNEVGKIAGSLSSVAKTIEQAATKDGDRSSPIGRIINNMEVFTADLAEISSGRKRKIGEIIDSVHDVTTGLSDVFNDQGEHGFKANWAKLSNTITKLDESMDNIKSITGKINSGEGTLGKLVNDETTVDSVNETLTQVNEFFGSAGKLRTDIDFHSEYLAEDELTKSYLSVKIQPGLDRFYEIGLVDDPRGVSEEEQVISGPTGGATTDTTTTTVFKNKLKFNALIAKNFFNLTVKAGIIENEGGVGFDYYLYSDKLKWNLDVYDFDEVNVRSSLKWSFYRGIYVLGGVDDILDKRTGISSYLGAGLYLTNDDIKLLLSGLSL
ncbi:MAG: MCE family protein [Bdellovibrionales bacterium]|nr:MCE family protein [Bdellovibrionales bacterium]